MDPFMIGVVFLVVMLALIVAGMPIAFAMVFAGTIGIIALEGFDFAATQVLLTVGDQATNFVLIAVPLYLLMGQLVTKSRIGEDLYDCVYKWIGWTPGGLAVASVLSCAGFGAVSGGSVAAVATMGPMCMPTMRQYRYDDKLGAGCIAAGGTLGILIPPSVILVVYGVWTETSIGALFIAGIVPGAIMTLSFCAVIIGMCMVSPQLGPRGPSFSWRDRFASLAKLLPTFSIFLIVIGGIYGGVFDPTEAAAVGAAGVFVIGLLMGRMTRAGVAEALIETTQSSAMIFFIIVGGHLVAKFVVLTDITTYLIDTIVSAGFPALVVILLFSLMYLVLGMVLDVWGMLILTVPFVFPVILDLGLDPVWFGIYAVMMAELALITPPVGVNVYVMAKVVPGLALHDIFRGVVPFFLAAVATVTLITLFPGIVTFLPDLGIR